MAGVAPEQALGLFMHPTEVHRSRATSRDASPTFLRPAGMAKNRLYYAEISRLANDWKCFRRRRRKDLYNARMAGAKGGRLTPRNGTTAPCYDALSALGRHRVGMSSSPPPRL